jgi:nitrogen fixation protein
MKKMMFLFMSLFVMNLAVFADNDKPIQVTEMPKEAQSFVKSHFANQSVAVAKMETDFFDKTYDVIFTNGDKVEFDKKGNWTKVDCEHTQVPQAVIPAAIQQYVSKNYPDAKVVKIEKTDRKGFDVDLSNGFDIEFDKKMRVVEVDR